jgi:hypothetical protein
MGGPDVGGVGHAATVRFRAARSGKPAAPLNRHRFRLKSKLYQDERRIRDFRITVASED